MKNTLIIIFLIPLLFGCQDKYNKPPFDKKEETLRKFPVEKSKSMVLDSLWHKRDSLTYTRLKNIEVLMMQETSYIPNWIGEFDKLEIFQVVNQKRKIKKIPSNVGKLSNIVQFDIPNNEITSLPESFYNLKKIKNIELKNNKIDSVSSKIGQLVNVQSLGITDNPSRHIPSEICNLKKMKYLDLDNTKITELPKCLGELQNIDWIHISGTQLTEFPIEILNSPNLQSIQAKEIKLKNYKEVKAICEKKNIRLSYDE